MSICPRMLAFFVEEISDKQDVRLTIGQLDKCVQNNIVVVEEKGEMCQH